MSNSGIQNAVPPVDTSGDTISVPSYVLSVNLYRSPSEQNIGAIQEERWKKIEQVEALENNIASKLKEKSNYALK